MSGRRASRNFDAQDITIACAAALLAQLVFVAVFSLPSPKLVQADISNDNAQPIAVAITPVLKLGSKTPTKLPSPVAAQAAGRGQEQPARPPCPRRKPRRRPRPSPRRHARRRGAAGARRGRRGRASANRHRAGERRRGRHGVVGARAPSKAPRTAPRPIPSRRAPPTCTAPSSPPGSRPLPDPRKGPVRQAEDAARGGRGDGDGRPQGR